MALSSGWQIDDSPAEFGRYLMALKDGRAAAGIGPKPDGLDLPSVWTTYFAADSADLVAEKVTRAGGQVMMPPFDVGEVGRMAVAVDTVGGAFGLWQTGTHLGAGIVNEPGTFCWNELHTREYASAKDFYTAVFGFEYQSMAGTEDEGYAVFTLPGSPDGIGGICDDTAMPDAPEAPTHWLTWFAVADVDDSSAQAGALGGQVLMAPFDMPIGRASIVTGIEGEVFGLIAMPPPATDS